MLAHAGERARALGREVALQIGDAHALDFPDATFDSVVMTLALCTIPDEHQAIREAKRVLRPGGTLILLEHVRSPLLPVRLVQRLLDPLLVRWKADHLLREPPEQLQQEGFAIQQCERRGRGLIERVVAAKPPDARKRWPLVVHTWVTSSISVACGITQSSLREAFEAEETGVALAAGGAVR